jgi:hypothetical protein
MNSFHYKEMKLFILLTTPFHPYHSQRKKADDIIQNIFSDLYVLKEDIEILTNNMIGCDYPMFYSNSFVMNTKKRVDICLKGGYPLCGLFQWENRNDV